MIPFFVQLIRENFLLLRFFRPVSRKSSTPPTHKSLTHSPNSTSIRMTVFYLRISFLFYFCWFLFLVIFNLLCFLTTFVVCKYLKYKKQKHTENPVSLNHKTRDLQEKLLLPIDGDGTTARHVHTVRRLNANRNKALHQYQTTYTLYVLLILTDVFFRWHIVVLFFRSHKIALQKNLNRNYSNVINYNKKKKNALKKRGAHKFIRSPHFATSTPVQGSHTTFFFFFLVLHNIFAHTRVAQRRACSLITKINTLIGRTVYTRLFFIILSQETNEKKFINPLFVCSAQHTHTRTHVKCASLYGISVISSQCCAAQNRKFRIAYFIFNSIFLLLFYFIGFFFFFGCSW